jgi:hypothetical protein
VLKRFRPWQIAVGLAALAAIAAGLVSFFSRNPALTAVEMAAYMPRGEATFLYADAALIRRSGLLEKLAGSTVVEDADYKKFIAETGFDYRRDLERIFGRSEGDTQLVLVEGRFDWQKLEGYALKQGGRCEQRFCNVKSSTPGRIVSFYPIRKNLMALAFSNAENAAREISYQPQKAALQVPSEPVWISIPGQSMRSSANLPAGTRLFVKALEAAQKVTFTLGPQQQNLELAMNVICNREEDAAVLKAQLEGLTTTLQKFIARERQSPNPADLSGILTAGVFDRAGRHVLGRWPIRREFLDSLSGKS